MTRSVDIDLAALARDLPPPALIPLDLETIIAERKAAFVARAAELGLVYDAEDLESDTAVKLLEAAAYRELIHRNTVNDATKAVLLPYARGADLDHLVARLAVERLTGEDDDALLQRYLLALEAFSTAGPELAYAFHARSAHPQVRDVAVYGPETDLVDPGQVGIYVMSTIGLGFAPPNVLEAVEAACSHEDVRPLTDQVLVQSIDVVPYAIEFTVRVGSGADPELVRKAAVESVAAYTNSRKRIGLKIPLSGLYRAAHVGGVEEVVLVAPAADVVPSLTQAPYCSAITGLVEVIGG